MNCIKKDSFYLNKVAVLSEETENYSIYTILPEYGEGTFTIFNIIPGLSLSLNNFIANNTIKNNTKNYRIFSEPILKINYCLKGKMLAYDEKGKVCISNKGSTAYYSGIKNIHSVEHFDKHYLSISLYGYVNEITNVFEEMFQIKASKFTEFYDLINQESNFIVINNDSKVIRLVNGIKEGIMNGENESIRLKAIELLLYELKNLKKNMKRKEVYFNRYTIDKIIDVERYITNNLEEKITLTKLSEDFNIPLDTLKRCFKQMFSTSIYAYIKKSRMEKGKTLLRSTDISITEIALTCGYCNHHSFSKAFKEHFKITPREIRKLY